MYITLYWKLFSPLKVSSSKSSCLEALTFMASVSCCSFWSNGSNGGKQIYLSLFCPDNFGIFSFLALENPDNNLAKINLLVLVFNK